VDFHFSVDDVFDSLFDKEHPGVEIVNELEYPVDLYCFYQGDKGTLCDITDNHFNGHVEFNVHGLDKETPPYSQIPEEQKSVFNDIYYEFHRIGYKRSNQTRLHYFSESYELSDYFLERGVDTLYTTDKPALLWRLPIELKETMSESGQCKHQGLNFVRTSLRIENLVGLASYEIADTLVELATSNKPISVMTHEYELMRPQVRELTNYVIKFLKDI